MAETSARSRVAICICTRNRPDELDAALGSIAALELAPAQVIVSDDSDDEIAHQVRNVTERRRDVVYTRGPRRGLAANRNHCLDRLDERPSAVAFVDDDVCLRPSFLVVAESALAQVCESTIVAGREIKNGIEVTPRNLSFWGHQEVTPRDASDLHGICINATIFPRSLFQQARFDETLWYGSEEADIAAQAEARGYTITYEPALVVDHEPSPINRTEYERYLDVSRLYSTYKRYRWLEHRPGKALAYAGLAPVHHVASSIKRYGLGGMPAALNTVACAGIKVFRGERARKRRVSVR